MVVGVVGAIALGGCSSSAKHSSGNGTLPTQDTGVDGAGARMTVTGQLEGVGGPAGRPVRHWPGTIHVRGTVHMDVATDQHGRFHLRLPPGHYVLTGLSPQYGDNQYSCRAEDALVVSKGAGPPVRMNVLCQMK